MCPCGTKADILRMQGPPCSTHRPDWNDSSHAELLFSHVIACLQHERIKTPLSEYWKLKFVSLQSSTSSPVLVMSTWGQPYNLYLHLSLSLSLLLWVWYIIVNHKLSRAKSIHRSLKTDDQWFYSFISLCSKVPNRVKPLNCMPVLTCKSVRGWNQFYARSLWDPFLQSRSDRRTMLCAILLILCRGDPSGQNAAAVGCAESEKTGRGHVHVGSAKMQRDGE